MCKFHGVPNMRNYGKCKCPVCIVDEFKEQINQRGLKNEKNISNK